MRVKIRLQDVGKKRQRKYWIVVQPIRQKLQGLCLERVGQWLPRNLKTVPRQVSLNTHRLRYWLSVGAEPTQQVHKLISKFGLLPPLPPKYGTVHSFEKPEREYQNTFFRGLGRSKDNQMKHGHRINFYYRQKLQEELNLVERRRRLAAELLANQGGSVTQAPSALSDQADMTDGYESDDPDIFARQDKFKKILTKMDEHRSENLLKYKGNDLRYNVYLRKLNKLSRKDLGLDILGYKDYVNNLKEFAHLTGDMNAFALEALAVGTDPSQRAMVTVKTFQPDVDLTLEGKERLTKNSESIIWTLKKLLRTGNSWISSRDHRAVKELDENMKLYLINNPEILGHMRRLFFRFKKDELEQAKHFELIRELKEDVSPEVLERANVSLREYNQIKLLIDLNMLIFEEESRIHTHHDLLPDNPMNHFVDFRRIPQEAKLPKEAKEIIYRPERMAKLSQAYRRLVQQLNNDFLRRKHEKQAEREARARRLNWGERIPPKKDAEKKMIARLCARIETDFKLSQDDLVRLKERDTQAKAPIEKYTTPMDWYKPLLSKLIEERRKIPKEERLKLFRQDEIDQVDTTDLEHWSLKGAWLRLERRDSDEEALDLLKEGKGEIYQSPYHAEIKSQRYNPLEQPQPVLEFSNVATDEVMQEAGEALKPETQQAKMRKAGKTSIFGKDVKEDAKPAQSKDKVVKAEPLKKLMVGSPKEALMSLIMEEEQELIKKGEKPTVPIDFVDEGLTDEDDVNALSHLPLIQAIESMELRKEHEKFMRGAINEDQEPEALLEIENLVQPDDMIDPTILDEVKLSEKRIIRNFESREDTVKRLLNFKFVYDEAQQKGTLQLGDVAIKRDFDALIGEKDKFKGNKTRLYKQIDAFLGIQADKASIYSPTELVQKSDLDYWKSQHVIDQKKTLQSVKNQLRQARQEMGIDIQGGKELAWLSFIADPENVRYANYDYKEVQKKQKMANPDLRHRLEERYMGQTDDEQAEIEGPKADPITTKRKKSLLVGYNSDEDVHFEVNTGEEMRRLILRHRLDITRLFFERDGGYPLRKFKEIYYKEMKENPDKYILSEKDGYGKQINYSATAAKKQPWQESQYAYENFIKRKNVSLGQSVGLSEQSAKAEVTRALILKAIESGALEANVGSQIRGASEIMTKVEEALKKASERLEDERFKAYMEKHLTQETQELLDTYNVHGLGAVQRQMMIKFCESLTNDDLKKFVIPFMQPSEVKQLENLEAQAAPATPAAGKAASATPVAGKPAGEGEEAAAEDEEDAVKPENEVDKRIMSMDNKEFLYEFYKQNAKNLGVTIKEDEEMPEKYKKFLEESDFLNMPDDHPDKKIVRAHLDRLLTFGNFDESKMTFRQRSKLYEINQFPIFAETVAKTLTEEFFLNPDHFEKNYSWDQIENLAKLGITKESLQQRKEKKAEEEKAKEKEVIKDMLLQQNELTKEDPRVRAITSEELEEILTKMYTEQEGWDVSDDEQAEKWFEEQFEKIRKTKLKQEFAIEGRGHPAEGDVWEKFVEDKNRQIQSLVPDALLYDDVQRLNLHESLIDRLQRYPNGFRHYENFASYSQVKKDATLEEYAQVMNTQVDFSDYVAIMAQNLREQLQTPEGVLKMKQQIQKTYGDIDDEEKRFRITHEMEMSIFGRRKYDEEEGDKQPGLVDLIMTNVDLYIQSEFFINQMRQQYTRKVQNFLLAKQVYSLVECLEETVDYYDIGIKIWEMPVGNTYVPVKNTIMKKPDLTAGADAEFGFRFQDLDKNRDKTRQRFGPLDQLNPLRGHRMAPGFPNLDRKLTPDNEMRKKFSKFRRLSKTSSQNPSVSRSQALFSTYNRVTDDTGVTPLVGADGGVSVPRKLLLPPINSCGFRQ